MAEKVSISYLGAYFITLHNSSFLKPSKETYKWQRKKNMTKSLTPVNNGTITTFGNFVKILSAVYTKLTNLKKFESSKLVVKALVILV